MRRLYQIDHPVQEEMMVRVKGMCDGGLLVEVEGGTRLLVGRKKKKNVFLTKISE